MPGPSDRSAVASRMPVLEIDRAALQANWRTLAARQPGARTGAAVKADGYGLGAADVATALHQAGCRDFFVAWASEGVAVREALARAGLDSGGAATRIYVLQGLEAATVALHLAHDLVPVLSTPDDVACWRDGTSAAASRVPAALQLETGMNRLGLGEADARHAAALHAAGDLPLCLVMSHLASADEPTAQSDDQLQRFLALSALFPGVPRSLANSAGVFLGPGFGFDLTRPGIGLYGGSAGPRSTGVLQPVARLTAAILQVRTARAGEVVGYGAAVRLERNTRIATVGIGYADGLPRAASGAGIALRPLCPAADALLAGQRVPVIGRISMDMTLLDVSALPEGGVQPGDRVEFFGPGVAIDDVAAAAGTIAYEILTGMGRRVARHWT
ncbi:alanine racemase [Aurantimonas sp. HBX-1]|uniref:alanine racemase n=1 Tax=Aurantimonas sp. HBX-1 TaxID=2906072 RepID=UPI001F1C8537|nr:alanine racemase [Aurantimonas sp. HBX-1]UIJ70310.1 alanine racemase [Aurantimonas sp. HBX-1]